MQRTTVFAVLFLVGCGNPRTPDLSHLGTVLSSQQIQTLRTDAGLTDLELTSMTVAQADKTLRKLSKPTASNPGDAFAYRHETMVDENGKIPDDALMKAIAHRDNLASLEAANGGIQPGSWTWMGPGNVGGRCRALWIQRSNPNVLVLGSVGGGIWRSTNAGGSWEAVNDYPASLAIGCMASPRNSSSVIWAGTGEGFGNTDSIRGAGIYRSTDSGRTWTRLTSTANSNFYFVNRLAFSPARSTTVFAATATGLWRSTNSGASWARVISSRTLDVKFHPTNGNLAVSSGRTASAVRYTTNGGSIWRTATGLPSTSRRVELAYSRSSPSIVFASVEISSGNSRVYRSTNGGRSYLLRSATGILGAQGWYDNALWVDPTNPNVILVGGIQMYRSTNAGVTFTNISGIHADQHLVVEHPAYNGTTNRTVYVCNDGGIYRARDVRTVSRTAGWTNLNNRIGITQFYGGAVSASGRAFGGTQDNGTQQLVSSTSKSFRSIRGADGMKCDADPTNFNFLFGETQYAGVFRSTNGGTSSQSIVNNMADSGRGKAPWIGALRLDPNNPNRLWLGSRRLWRTTNAKTASARSVSWRLVRTNVENYSSVDIARGNSNLVVAAENGGSIFRSTNGTALTPRWTKIDRTPLPNRFVTTIRINPLNHTEIYVAFGGFTSGNVWHTLNSGASWQNISGRGSTALPAAPVRGFAVHPKNLGWIYAGTEVGVFASTNNGRTWSASNDGPATVSVDEVIVRDDGSIYVFTHGRGAYRAHAGTDRDARAQTTRASLTWLDGQSNGHSSVPTISSNGRFVAFASDATNIWPLDTNSRRDVFVRDRQEGTSSRDSVSSTGRQSNGTSDRPDISANGRFVAYQSLATNLVSRDTNSRYDIFVRDRTFGTTERVSLSSTGVQGNNNSFTPSITGDGRYVLFYSFASNLVFGDTNRQADVFRHDRHTNVTVRVSVGGSFTQSNGASTCTRQAVSADGRYTVFQSGATNLVARDTNRATDVFLRDVAGRLATTIRVSVSSRGVQANGSSFAPAISADGRYIVYYSTASNLVSGDTNGRSDVFLYDRITRSTSRLSTSASGVQGNNHSWLPIISDDGNTITFESIASNLVRDLNGKRDVFMRTRSPRRIVRISVDSEGGQSSGSSYHGSPSSDGKFIAYRSDAANLVNNDTNARNDIFVFESLGTGNVFPRGVTNVAGSTGTAHPISQRAMRLQQCARETINRRMTIRRLSFRRDNAANNTTALQRAIDISFSMGNGDIDTMTSRFSSNWIGRPTTVITRKQFNLPDWRPRPAGLARFDTSFPLDSPYLHSGARHLLWEAQVYANSRTGLHPTDAHSGSQTLFSTSRVIGVGCNTNTGRNYGHSFTVWSNGPSSSYRITASRAPRNAPVWLGLGGIDPNLQLPGLCARLHTDGTILVPIGTATSAGTFSRTLPGVRWRSSFRGLTLYTQLWSPGGSGALSYGRRVVLPTTNPGTLIKRLFSFSRVSSTGALQSLGAVFKLE